MSNFTDIKLESSSVIRCINFGKQWEPKGALIVLLRNAGRNFDRSQLVASILEDAVFPATNLAYIRDGACLGPYYACILNETARVPGRVRFFENRDIHVQVDEPPSIDGIHNGSQ